MKQFETWDYPPTCLIWQLNKGKEDLGRITLDEIKFDLPYLAVKQRERRRGKSIIWKKSDKLPYLAVKQRERRRTGENISRLLCRSALSGS